MKAIVFSDSHTDVATMEGILIRENPDLVFHLGDHWNDARKLEQTFPELKFFCVPGNCDPSGQEEELLKLTAKGKKILLTHGHTFGVLTEKGRNTLFRYGMENGFDLILFGHTHQPYLFCEEGIWMANPGRIGKKSSRLIHATYILLLLSEDGISITFHSA
jgi:putative phosphoesterase